MADRDQLEAWLRRLSVEHRTVIVLHHYLDLPMVEVAAVMGASPGTTYSRMHHALRALRAAIEADERAPTPGRVARRSPTDGREPDARCRHVPAIRSGSTRPRPSCRMTRPCSRASRRACEPRGPDRGPGRSARGRSARSPCRWAALAIVLVGLAFGMPSPDGRAPAVGAEPSMSPLPLPEGSIPPGRYIFPRDAVPLAGHYEVSLDVPEGWSNDNGGWALTKGGDAPAGATVERDII